MTKNKLGITSIAQGTALSGLISNIFMINFDVAAVAFTEGVGGFYRRYSNYIFIVLPTSVSFANIEKKVAELLNLCCLDSIKLNANKTEKKIYQIGANDRGIIIDANKKPHQKFPISRVSLQWLELLHS